MKAGCPHLRKRTICHRRKTATGKTAAFGLPVVQRIIDGEIESAIVLTPTRELAIQVRDEIERFAQYSSLRTALIYGGASMDAQRQRALVDEFFSGVRSGKVVLLAEGGALPAARRSAARIWSASQPASKAREAPAAPTV